MNREEIEKVEKASANITAERLEELKALFPEVFAEGKVDFGKLRAVLGDIVDERPERYSFTWAGKRDAIQMLQTPSRGTLKPERSESVDFDTTQNLFIEGDNLEVLKLLRKSYDKQVKMIYIDPPYNTGNDFIYPDNYSDPLDTYLQLTGQKDGEGNLRTSNPETSGRYHSAWLSMMYPRLFLARQLLREDGVIFVSIDDHEVHNLRLLMNEVFGEENFIAQLVWEKGRKNDAKLFSVGHEYITIYGRSLASLRELGTVWREPKPGAKEIWDEYCRLRDKHGDDNKAIEKNLQEWYKQLPNGHPSKALSRYKHVDKYGPWRDRDLSWPGGGGPRFDVIHPVTKEPCKVPDRGWGFTTPEAMQRKIQLKLVEFREDHTKPPFLKAHLRPIPDELEEDENALLNGEDEEEEVAVGMRVISSVIYKQSQVAVKYLRNLMGEKIFNNPKDHEILARLIRYCTSSNNCTSPIILDFFAGSASTAEAVLQLNHQEDGNRRFIMVQLPQQTDNAQFPTIADIGKERLRRVIQKIKVSDTGQLHLLAHETSEDLGFKVFKLAKSNYRQWKELPSDTEPKEYIEQLELFSDPLLDGWQAEEVIYEVLLKEGYSLTSCTEQVEGITGATVWKVTDEDKGQHFYISLDNQFHFETARELKLSKNDLLICRDMAIDDTTAANLILQCRLKTI
jgi:adenine-specific DNA-methyltransferase